MLPASASSPGPAGSATPAMAARAKNSVTASVASGRSASPGTAMGCTRRRKAGLLFHGVQEFPAGTLAAPAGLGADPAVRVHPGVPLAFIAAALADGHAGIQQR